MDLVSDLTGDRPQNRWTREQRVFLCCMIRFFQKDNHAFSKIFSHSFEAELRQSGYTTGIAWGALYIQWRSMKRLGDSLWGDVHLSPFTNGRDGSWYPVITKIKQIAQHLDIHLVEKDEDDVDTSNYHSRPPRNLGYHEGVAADTARSEPQVQSTPHEPDESDENQEVPILVTAGGKMCLFCFQEGNIHPDLQVPNDEIPPLLYRWSNVDSQGVNSRRLFQAGLFSEETEYFHPSEITQDEFNNFVENHVRIRKSLSPFISTFKMMLAPMHRGLRNKEGAIVSIIDRSKLKTPIYSAYTMVRTLNLRFLWYNGAAEYLIWGNIPKSAIICSFKASTLLKLAHDNPEFEDLLQFDSIASSRRSGKALHRVLGSGPGGLNHATGVTIGRFLFKLGVPYEYCKTVSHGMYYSWRMKRGGNLEEFDRGVEDGYYALNQHLSPPPTMINTADEDMPDDISEMSEFSELPQGSEISDLSDSLELPVPPQALQTPQASQDSHAAQASRASEVSDVSETFNIFDPFDIPNETASQQSDEETVTNDDPRTSMDLFSAAGSPFSSPVIKLFDGATKQWTAQQRNNEISLPEQPGSSARTPISLDDSDDDEFDKIFSACKVESSVFGSSPPAMNDLEQIVPPKPVVVKNEKDTLATFQSGRSIPARSAPRDRFAADRERVLHFWG